MDDAAYTFRNPFVAGGLSLTNVCEAFANLRHGGIWMPLTYVSYMADASFCRAVGVPLIGWMHLVNALLHVVNFLLLYRLLSGLPWGKGGSPALLLATLFWALHPLRVEPVAWIAARKELLWTLFSLLGLLCWRTGRWWPWTYLCCALACLAKPTALCFPLLAGLVEWLDRRTEGQSLNPDGLRRFALHRYLPLVLMAAVTAAIASYSQTHVAGQTATSLYAVPLLNRCVNALSALGFYIRATVFPVGLHVDCRAVVGLLPLDGWLNLAVLALSLVVMAGLVLSKGVAASVPGEGPSAFEKALFAGGWILASLGPTLGILGGFGIEAHADRFTYLPSMALSFLLAGVFCHRAGRWLAAVALPAFVVLSFLQLGFWRDDAAAHARAYACDPCHPRALVHVADARCARRHDFDGGIRLYRQALSLSGTVPQGGFDAEDVKARLAYALASRGGCDDLSEVKRLGANVLQDVHLDRRGLMLDALGTAFLAEGNRRLAERLFRASLDAPDRFWPKASTQRKMEACRER